MNLHRALLPAESLSFLHLVWAALLTVCRVVSGVVHSVSLQPCPFPTRALPPSFPPFLLDTRVAFCCETTFVLVGSALKLDLVSCKAVYRVKRSLRASSSRRFSFTHLPFDSLSPPQGEARQTDCLNLDVEQEDGASHDDTGGEDAGNMV